MLGLQLIGAITVSILISTQALAAPALKKADSPSVTENAKASATDSSKCETYPQDVSGEWVSEWGPVSFQKETDGTYSGQWIEGKDKAGKEKIGKIEHGHFNDKTGEFNYDFIETWTKLKGQAKMKLAKDHSQLSGTWTREQKNSKISDKGSWSMKRPAAKK